MRKIMGLVFTTFAALVLHSSSFATPVHGESFSGYPIKITEKYIKEAGTNGKDEYGNDVIEIPLGPSSGVQFGIEKPELINSSPIEFTKEYIEKHGVRKKDENGKDIIELPLGPSFSNINALPNAAGVDDRGGYSSKHFSFVPHFHEVINVSKYAYSGFVPVTSYAAPGFTISKSTHTTFNINLALNLNGGITNGIVETALGASLGGAYETGYGESYTAVIPKGYIGRIAYRYCSYMYDFTNKATYIHYGNPPYFVQIPLYMEVQYHRCRGESRPYHGFYYLQIQEY